jgi:hypothetical protein
MAKKIHGSYTNPLYQIWWAMRQRCANKNSPDMRLNAYKWTLEEALMK